MMFHLIHPSIHNDGPSVADELAGIAAFMAYAMDDPAWATDERARVGAGSILSALSSCLVDLGAEMGRSSRTTIEKAPDLTEPLPCGGKQRRAG